MSVSVSHDGSRWGERQHLVRRLTERRHAVYRTLGSGFVSLDGGRGRSPPGYGAHPSSCGKAFAAACRSWRRSATRSGANGSRRCGATPTRRSADGQRAVPRHHTHGPSPTPTIVAVILQVRPARQIRGPWAARILRAHAEDRRFPLTGGRGRLVPSLVAGGRHRLTTDQASRRTSVVRLPQDGESVEVVAVGGIEPPTRGL